MESSNQSISRLTHFQFKRNYHLEICVGIHTLNMSKIVLLKRLNFNKNKITIFFLGKNVAMRKLG